MSKLNSAAILVGRIFISIIFFSSGYGKIVGFAATQKYMENFSIPFAPFFLVLAIFAELAGALVSGAYTRLGALSLLLFIIPTTLIFHTDFSQRMQIIQFQKNVAIMGGIIALMASGDGGMGYDSWKKK